MGVLWALRSDYGGAAWKVDTQKAADIQTEGEFWPILDICTLYRQ